MRVFPFRYRRRTSLSALVAVLAASSASFAAALPHSSPGAFAAIERPPATQGKSEQPSVTVEMPRFLKDLDLDAAQRERILPILLELAPMLRTLETEIRASQAMLDGLAAASSFNDEVARQAAAAAGRSIAALVLLRARGEHQILAQLTETQRERVERRRRGATAELDEVETPGPVTTESGARGTP